MEENRSDEQLVRDYLDGDEAALGSLIERYLKPVYNFVLRLSGNASEAEDITQETFVKVWKNIRKYRPDHPFRAWLYAIARHVAVDWHRKRRPTPFSDFENEEGDNPFEVTLVDDAPWPDELAALAQEHERLTAAVQELSATYQAVLYLHHQEGYSFEETGRILGKPLNTVKSQYRRALLALKNRLKEPPPDSS